MFEIDSRTSDAIAMAVRFECPIYTYDFILEAAGIVLDDQEEEAPATISAPEPAPAESNQLDTLSADLLHQRLQEVIAKEDYEMAARIRDELKKREKN